MYTNIKLKETTTLLSLGRLISNCLKKEKLTTYDNVMLLAKLDLYTGTGLPKSRNGFYDRLVAVLNMNGATTRLKDRIQEFISEYPYLILTSLNNNLLEDLTNRDAVGGTK